jgi:hypothetical protein
VRWGPLKLDPTTGIKITASLVLSMLFAISMVLVEEWVCVAYAYGDAELSESRDFFVSIYEWR